MFELVKDQQERWDLIGDIIEVIQLEREVWDKQETYTICNMYQNCPNCGNNEYIYLRGFHIAGWMCVHCGHTEMDNIID